MIPFWKYYMHFFIFIITFSVNCSENLIHAYLQRPCNEHWTKRYLIHMVACIKPVLITPKTITQIVRWMPHSRVSFEQETPVTQRARCSKRKKHESKVRFGRFTRFFLRLKNVHVKRTAFFQESVPTINYEKNFTCRLSHTFVNVITIICTAGKGPTWWFLSASRVGPKGGQKLKAASFR